MDELEEALIYVTNSKRRADVLLAIRDLHFARNYEVSEMLCLSRGHVSLMFSDLLKYELIQKKKVDSRNVYFLTKKGEKIIEKMYDYYGLNRK